MINQEININQLCEVKLTPYGLDILKSHSYKYISVKNNIFKTELWDLFSIFGQYLYMGNMNIPFEGNNIKIISEY